MKSGVLTALAVFVFTGSTSLWAGDDSPLKILVITEGCCHDYPFQTESMQKALKARNVAAEWTVIAEGGKGTKAEIAFYDDPDYHHAKGLRIFHTDGEIHLVTAG